MINKEHLSLNIGQEGAVPAGQQADDAYATLLDD
jgi:hypothetical protein